MADIGNIHIQQKNIGNIRFVVIKYRINKYDICILFRIAIHLHDLMSFLYIAQQFSWDEANKIKKVSGRDSFCVETSSP